MLIDGQLLGLEADVAHAEGLEPLRDERPEAARLSRPYQREAGCLAFHLQPVAAVAQDFRGVLSDHQVAQAAAESREIADVLRCGDDQPIELELEEAPASGGQPALRFISSHRRS